MADPTPAGSTAEPAAAPRRPARRRQLIALLTGTVTVLVALSLLLHDERFFDSAVPIGTVLAALLLAGVNHAEPDAGRSPWTPPALFAVATISGSVVGLAGLGLHVEDPAIAHALLVAVLLLLLADVAVLVTVLVRGQLRGESWRARTFPSRSGAGRPRTDVMAAALSGLFGATIAVSPWVQDELWFWVPLAIVDAVAPPLLLWWVLQSASSTAGDQPSR
jgi:hypothetical protein